MIPTAEDVSVYCRVDGFRSGLRAAEGGKYCPAYGPFILDLYAISLDKHLD